MATGNKTYKGLAVPLSGESIIYQTTAADDILTVERITAGTGDYLVLRQNDDTEDVVINKSGHVILRAGRYVGFGVVTTAPTTGLVKGALLVGFDGTQARLGVCTSTAAQTLQ